MAAIQELNLPTAIDRAQFVASVKVKSVGTGAELFLLHRWLSSMLLIALLGVDSRVLGVSKSHFYCLHFAISALTHFFPLLFAPVTRENDERRSARLRSAKGRRHRHRRPGREHIHHHRGSQDVPLPSKAGFVALELDGDQKINFRRHATAKNAKSG